MYEIKIAPPERVPQAPKALTAVPREVPLEPEAAAPARENPLRIIWLLVVLACMVGVRYAVPRFAEEIQYSITRGRQRAQHELAQQHLASSPLSALSHAYQLVSQKVSPSVVHINVTNRSPVIADKNIGFFPEHHDTSGQGSGVIVDEEGYVVTNLHVIKGATEIEVGLSDGRRVGAQIVGTDPDTDLALLKVDASGLIPAEWGDSDALEVGSLVWACGSPFGLQRTITFGILSGKNRAGMAGTAYQDFLQTDAAVNPGNSGGPLVDEQGRVIGINTAIVGDYYQGISFAVPSSVAYEVVERLRRDGHVVRGWLGVQMGDVTPETADRLGLPQPYGALVVNVVNEGPHPSPAARAGIRQGDVIVRWNGNEVVNPTTLSRLVARTQIGSEATVVVLRSGEEIMLNVAVGERPVFE